MTTHPFIRRLPPIAYGKNLYILGISDDGPSNIETQVHNIEQAYSVFGNGSLTKAFQEAYQVAGNQINYYLVRMFDMPSILQFQGIGYRESDIEQSVLLTITSKYGGTKYNDIYITLTKQDYDYVFTVYQENLGYSNQIYSTHDYPTIFDLCKAINTNADSETGLIYADSKYMDMSIKDIYAYAEQHNQHNRPLYLTNTRTDIQYTKNQLYIALDESLEAISDQNIDIIYVADTYVDDIDPLIYGDESNRYARAFYTQDRDYLTLPHLQRRNETVSYHERLIEFCEQQLISGIATHAVIGFSNPEYYTEYVIPHQPYLSKAITATAFYDRRGFIQPIDDRHRIDNGKYISVSLGEFEYYDVIGEYPYYGPSASAYAAFLALSSKADSLTNTPIPNITNIRYHLDDSELLRIGRLGITAFRKSILQDSIVVSNAVTAQMTGSPYCNVANLRMIQTVICYMREFVNQYVGSDIQMLANTKVIDNGVGEAISIMTQQKLVTSIAYNVNYNLFEATVSVSLDILALNAVEYISSTGEVKI